MVIKSFSESGMLDKLDFQPGMVPGNAPVGGIIVKSLKSFIVGILPPQA